MADLIRPAGWGEQSWGLSPWGAGWRDITVTATKLRRATLTAGSLSRATLTPGPLIKDPA